MKIALIAMSGVRALNTELMEIGLNLPGFVERSKVIASLPSLGLLTLAGLTPQEHAVDYIEVADLRAVETLPRGYDVAAISSFSAQIFEAYELADRLRAIGTKVVLGGLHVTALPDEAAAHADVVVVGEAEFTWPTVVADASRGQLRQRYEPPTGQWFDFAKSPMPRFELLDIDNYNRLTVQTSRGCPHRCDFCASSILLTPKYRVKPVERVIAEIRRIKDVWPQPFIEFADDNSFVLRKHYKRLLRALRHEKVKWFTEADISIADDPELLTLMRESGCRQVLCGLESPVRDGLDGRELRRNWKLQQFDRYEWAVRTIQSHGITVNGCFVLGLDGQTPDVFEAVYDFVDKTSLYDVQITVATAFPGTPMHEQLSRERRIIHEEAWDRCTLFDVNIVPTHMTPDELQTGLLDLAKRLYDADFTRRRREGFFRQLREYSRPRTAQVEADDYASAVA